MFRAGANSRTDDSTGEEHLYQTPSLLLQRSCIWFLFLIILFPIARIGSVYRAPQSYIKNRLRYAVAWGSLRRYDGERELLEQLRWGRDSEHATGKEGRQVGGTAASKVTLQRESSEGTGQWQWPRDREREAGAAAAPKWNRGRKRTEGRGGWMVYVMLGTVSWEEQAIFKLCNLGSCVGNLSLNPVPCPEYQELEVQATGVGCCLHASVVHTNRATWV